MTSRLVLAVVPDLILQTRVRDQANRAGYEVVVATTQEGADRALSHHLGPVVLDLDASAVDWRAVITVAKERDLPVLAFGRNVEATLKQAREAGCDRVAPRSALDIAMRNLLAGAALAYSR